MAAESSSSSASRSSSNATADSYIGSLISLTSKSEIRYEGILYNINTDESSIGLRNVRAFGTENRKKDGPQVAATDKIYEYILFRGSDIKDLQVKSSPSVQTTPSINSDPAIIQSHYPPSAPTSTALPTATSITASEAGSHSTPLGHPGSTYPGGLPLYPPGGNLSSWGPSPPPNANGSGLAMPVYWQGYYGTPNALPQLHQQPLLRPPMPPNMQQMPYPGFNTSLPTNQSSLPGSNLPLSTGVSNLQGSNLTLPTSTSNMPGSNMPLLGGAPSLPASNLPEYPHIVPPVSNSLSSSPALPASTLPLSIPPMQPSALGSDNLGLNKAPVNRILQSGVLPSLAPLATSSPDLSSVLPSVPSKSNAVSVPVLQHQNTSEPSTTVIGTSSSILTETATPSLITPGQLLQTGSSSVSLNQTSVTAQKDVEVVQVSTTSPSEAPVPVSTEAQPPILPLPTPTRSYKPNGGPHHMRHNYRGRGGRGSGVSILPIMLHPGWSSSSSGCCIIFSLYFNYFCDRPSYGTFVYLFLVQQMACCCCFNFALIYIKLLSGVLLLSKLIYNLMMGVLDLIFQISRSTTKFSEDFDFEAMNEKFNKDEVWGHLGKSSKSHLKDKDGDGIGSDEDDLHDEYDAELPQIEIKPLYNKDDFFDSLSSNIADNDTNHNRPRFSEQMKLDAEVNDCLLFPVVIKVLLGLHANMRLSADIWRFFKVSW
ncbi:OLC1v1032415C3 [Oldenlandia corymbosa var. corymbosa]|uniref:OLC1v1032415C3 n=1 Tax=Oldenlandia corymbosa var. corymbosa TaxID=529605 RepID=A0AAV1CL54_OLDCO|nr:OLC1v1032415C3 [Oldenlandia corymbosa var. corymbosa]